MASLRTAVVQTYNCGSCGFSILTSISCLLYGLNCEECSGETTILPARKSCTQTSFENIKKQLDFEKGRSTWISSLNNHSLLQVGPEPSEFSSGEEG